MNLSMDEVKELAANKEYKRIPVCEELLADAFTPIEVMRKLRAASRHVFMLESASQSQQWGRYTFLGFDPHLEITCSAGLLRLRRNDDNGKQTISEERVTHPNVALRKLIAEYKSPEMPDMPPFTGGLVGFFSFDYIRYAEPKLKFHAEDGEVFRDMDLMLLDDVIAFDHYRQKVFLITGVKTADLEASYREAEKRLGGIRDILEKGEKADIEKLSLQSEIEPEFTEERFTEMVKKAKHYIHEGDIFQVVLSNPLRAKATGSLFDTYRMLRVSNPSPYMFYFFSDDIEIAGASPETLVKLDDGRLSTFPLAGTRPRGKTREEDERLEKYLLSDEKELAEHNMLVDLGRNDMGKVCRLGSVKVEKYLGIERFSQVMHIGSTVVGEIAKGRDAVDAIDAILPAGTLSGAPKFRACEIIEELEHSKRGIYGGAIGYLDFTGNMDVCIAIRLVYKSKDEITIRSGAGIVADSDPKKEYEECSNKAKAVVLAIKRQEEI